MSVLADLIDARAEALLAQWMSLVSANLAPVATTTVELRDHIPNVLGELTQTLRRGRAPEHSALAREHGRQRHRVGFDLEQLVREYGALRHLLMELACTQPTSVQPAELVVLADFFSTAIAEGVAAYTHQQATERQEAERKRELLRAQRQEAYEVLQHGDPVVIVDAQWRIVFASDSWLQLVQLTREQALGRSQWELFPAANDPARTDFATLHTVMNERRAAAFTEYFQPLDLWSAVSVYPTTSGGVALFIRDVTVDKRQQAEVQKHAQFERLLIGIVSHDLRTPLNAITLGTGALLRREGLDERATQLLVRVLNSADSATRMVRDLLDFTQARIGGGIPLQPAPTDLHALIERVVEELAATHPERQLHLQLDGDGHGRWDGDRLAQVLSNLVGNALKYGTPDAPVTVRCSDDGEDVVVRVHNGGAPIAVDALARLFEPLQRASDGGDRRDRSVGLGLFIVRHLVEAHGGHVAVESTAASGTTFTVRLPRELLVLPGEQPTCAEMGDDVR